MAKMKQFMEAGIDAIHTDEIQAEAVGFIASVNEGVELETIIRELYQYSQAVSAMVISKMLQTLYSDETIEGMISEYTDTLSAELVGNIEDFLKKEGN